MVYEQEIPEAMKKDHQWVCWRSEKRGGKTTKVPVNPATGRYARSNTPKTWSDFETAVRYYQKSETISGIGFMFSGDGEYAGVDLDGCRDPETGAVEDWAVEIIRRLDSYTERSPSGTGYHVIVYGSVPDGGNRSGDLEMYDSHRYFTVTGDRVPGGPKSVNHRPKQLHAIHQEYIATYSSEQATAPIKEQQRVPIPDQELLEKAKNAVNGRKFQSLWNGDIAGYKSHSEADQALCNLLAFWTGGDPDRIEKLFSMSGLVRDKWRKRPRYRERTIQNAIQSCSEFYEPTTSDYPN